jgi:hypothetical protein
MNANNAFKIFCYLYLSHHSGRTPMVMKDCINNLTHSLLQQGDAMRYGSIVMERHQVLLKTLLPLLLVMVGLFDPMQRTNLLHPQQLLMVLEQPMPVHLELQLLLSLLGVSIKRKFVSIKERETMLQEFTNQCPC